MHGEIQNASLIQFLLWQMNPPSSHYLCIEREMGYKESLFCSVVQEIWLNVTVWQMSWPCDVNTWLGWTQSVSIYWKVVVRLNLYRWAWCGPVTVFSQSSHKADFNSARYASLMSAQSEPKRGKSALWSWDVRKRWIWEGSWPWEYGSGEKLSVLTGSMWPDKSCKCMFKISSVFCWKVWITLQWFFPFPVKIYLNLELG